MSEFVQWPYVLRRGHSANPAQGACAMAAVAWLMHGEHTDAPECACPVIAAYVTRGNDAMPDDVRQRLVPYLHRIAGSRSKESQSARTRILVLGALRIFAPRALDAQGLHHHAAILRDLPDTVDMDEAVKAAAAANEAARAAVWAARAANEARAAAAALAAAAATATAARAARAAATAAAWDDYFIVLDQALNAGPQGEPWSADGLMIGVDGYRAAGGLVSV
jgi:hypothetical protein